MAAAEVVVGHGELFRGELFIVGLAGAGDVARAPAAIDGLPVAVVDLHCVPGVIRVLGGHWRAGGEGGGEAETFAVASYDDGFETSFAG